jgi:hypothetical protein
MIRDLKQERRFFGVSPDKLSGMVLWTVVLLDQNGELGGGSRQEVKVG